MRLFYFNKDKPGELEFAWTWLPHWITFHGDIMETVHKAAQAAIPKGLTVEQLTDEHWAELERVAIEAAVSALPYVTGLRGILEALKGADLDASKAPKWEKKGRPMPPVHGGDA